MISIFRSTNLRNMTSDVNTSYSLPKRSIAISISEIALRISPIYLYALSSINKTFGRIKFITKIGITYGIVAHKVNFSVEKLFEFM